MTPFSPLPNHSAFPESAPETVSYDAFLRQNTATGQLKIQASRAHSALPTAGVRIRVISRFTDARVLFFDGVTDSDGLISGIVLPAPPKAASLQPGMARHGAWYRIFASHPDFEPGIYEAELFEGITSILPIDLQLPMEVL